MIAESLNIVFVIFAIDITRTVYARSLLRLFVVSTRLNNASHVHGFHGLDQYTTLELLFVDVCEINSLNQVQFEDVFIL